MSSHIPPEVDEAIRAFIRKHRRGIRMGCLFAGIFALLIAILTVWGLFRGAVHVKNWAAGNIPSVRLPLEWEKPLGEAALAQLRPQFQFVTDPQILDPINRLATPLFEKCLPDRFSIFVTESKDVNAMALPGGYIVIHRGLLERARTAEEVQGVLAHEMAHIEKRHGVIQLAQNIGLDLAIQQLQGGENKLLDSLIKDSGQLLGFKFSRDHERAADDRGWELLGRAEINPAGMVDFFAGLNADTSVPIPFLSTHPAPQERMDRLRQKAAALGPIEYRSFAADFTALQNRLKSNSPR